MNNNGFDDDIDLLEYWRVVSASGRLIAAATIAAFVIALVASLVMPNIYASTASIMPPQKDSGPFSAGMAASSGSVGGSLISSLLGESSQTDLWLGILKSRKVRDAVIKDFDMEKLYGASTMDDTRKELDNNLKFETSDEGILYVTFMDKDPKRAAEVANALVTELDRVNRDLVMSAGQRMRAFVEKRLTGAKKDLREAEDALRDFQEKHSAIKLDDQSAAIFDAISKVKAETMAKEVALETLRSYATDTNPEVELLGAEVRGLKARLKGLEQGEPGSNGPGRPDVFIPTEKIPGIAFRYARLMREVQVQEAVYEVLTRQYEVARIMEAKDTPTVQVLDTANIPEVHARPKRFLIVALSTVGALFLSVFFTFIRHYVRRARSQGL